MIFELVRLLFYKYGLYRLRNGYRALLLACKSVLKLLLEFDDFIIM